MADLVIVIPSRGRPQAAEQLVDVFAETCTGDTYLCFAVDKDDPQAYDYPIGWEQPPNVGIAIADSHNMGQALHMAATELAAGQGHYAIGFMGDDHRPRTVGWDKAYVDALRELGSGIVYGDDLLQGQRLPTQVAMTSDIIRELGFMAPPGLIHLYFDNFWRDLGAAAGCLRYLPDVVVEHVHPIAGKAEWDDGYRRVNDSAMYQKDEATYKEYLRTRFAADVAKVKALRHG